MLNLDSQTWQFQDDGTMLETREIFARLLSRTMPDQRLCRGPEDPHWKPVGLRFRLIGGYGVLGELGEGTFGKVVLGVAIARSSRKVAIKCPSDRLLDDYAEAAGLQTDRSLSQTENQRAGRSWARLQIGQVFSKETALTARLAMCPHVVKVVDHDVTVPYLALEYCNGGSLARRIKAPYHLVDVLNWGFEIASALEAAHGLQPDALVHRDLKPDNILLHDGRVKVSDFGTSQLTQGTGSLRSLSGGYTPVYAAPESFDNRAYPATDIWSLGVILYELLSGHRPFDGDSLMSIARNIERKAAPPLARAGGIPAGPELVAFIHACLAKDPSARPSAGEARGLLRACLGGAATVPGPSNPAMASEVSSAATLVDSTGGIGAVDQGRNATIAISETALSKTAPLPRRSSLPGAAALGSRVSGSSASRRAPRKDRDRPRPSGSKAPLILAGLVLLAAGWVGFAGCYPLEERLATWLRGPLELRLDAPRSGVLVTDTLITVRGKASHGGVSVLVSYRDHTIFKRTRADEDGVFKASIAIPEDLGACRLTVEARGHLIADNSRGYVSRAALDLWVARRPLEAALTRAARDSEGALTVEGRVKHRIREAGNPLVLAIGEAEHPVAEDGDRFSASIPKGAALKELSAALRESGSGRSVRLKGAITGAAPASLEEPTSPELARALDAADQARDKGELAEARRLYSRALVLSPSSSRALRERGTVIYRLGDYAAAIEDFDRLVALRPKDARAWNLRGDARYGLGQREESFKDYREAARLDPQDSNSLYDLAWVYCDMARYEEALTCSTRAIELAPGQAWNHFIHGRTLYAMRRLNESLVAFDKAIAIDAKLTSVHNRRGDVLYDLKRYDEARASYDKAVAMDPSDGNAYYDRGWMYQDEGKQAEALEEFNKAIAVGYRSFRAYKRRGDALVVLERLDEALADYNKSIALNPDFAAAYQQRGQLLRGRGRLKEALADLRKAVELSPPSEAQLGPQIKAIEAELEKQ